MTTSESTPSLVANCAAGGMLAQSAHPLAILVADDVIEIRTVLRSILVKAGHTVVCAASGEDALKLLQAQPFDLLITDVLMPDGDGLGIIMAIRKANLSVRVLVISGGGKHFDAENCVHTAESLGAHAALLKPFGPEALFAAVGRAMGT